MHWITISTIGCNNGEVNVYDSLPCMDLPLRVKQQIACILYNRAPVITLNVKIVQTQRGGSNCGLFSLAFVTSLCVGDDPTTINYVQKGFAST